jgi:hypothetical protein
MLNYFKGADWIAELRDRRSEAGIRRTYRKELRTAQKEHATRDRLKEIEWSMYSELEMIDEERQLRTQLRLRNNARNYGIEVPAIPVGDAQEDSCWRRSNNFGYWLLKPPILKQFNAELRQEKKERREAFLAWWVPITTALVTILSLITTLAATCSRPAHP